ncbi:hypothetical protein AA13595_1305 [Gluconacetobacter johannae DSM 13595]|uniref:Pectate lyase superfamily protein domain-containing protein n=1 Tax=Gluconacetobacter johannae TaxID=112140 RepID=A0A7W4P463_9PROT|nr:hypothetical protein [Gluconacetobacter johannae]MBB2176787.1 hypothetical protein [Gluconacetobacter johannae]GBQ84030.1 hypothetical protein AA13595_1305 [Gluconacetobacter johannae DSM 13595]
MLASRIAQALLLFAFWFTPTLALAQSQIVPFTPGQVLGAAQLNALQSGKADYSGLVAEIARAEAAESALQSGTVAKSNGSSSNQTLTTPTITNATIDGLTSGGLIQPPGVSILANGARCDGVTDDTAAINAVLAAYRNVSIPHGISQCNVSGTILIPNGESLVGSGVTAATFMSTSSTAPLMRVAAGADNFTLSGFTLDRNVVPTASSAAGLNILGGTNQGTITNVKARDQWYGFALGGASSALIWNVLSENNYSDGFYITNSLQFQTAQWNMLNVVSQLNDGAGFNVVSTPGTNMVLLPWEDTGTFANTQGGYRFQGRSDAPITNINLQSVGASTDGDTELFFDTYGGHITIGGGGFVEAAGTDRTGSHGRPTAASHTGFGIYFSGSVQDVSLGQLLVFDNSQAGIDGGPYRFSATGTLLLQNGANQTGACGINLNNVTAGNTVQITGIRSGNLNTTSPQGSGVCLVNGAGVTITGSDLSFNSGQPVYVQNGYNGLTAYGNVGWVTSSAGAATIPAGSYTVTVNHGLSAPPAYVVGSPVTQLSSGTTYWVDTTTEDSFVLHISGAQTSDTIFNWNARMLAN